MNWTRYPSKAAAGRDLGMAGATIGDLARSRKTNHAGYQARNDDDDGDDSNEASFCASSDRGHAGGAQCMAIEVRFSRERIIIC
jgi:hypothetical protein